MRTFTLRLPDELVDKIDAEAKKLSISRTSYIRISLEKDRSSEKLDAILDELRKLTGGPTPETAVKETPEHLGPVSRKRELEIFNGLGEGFEENEK